MDLDWLDQPYLDVSDAMFSFASDEMGRMVSEIQDRVHYSPDTNPVQTNTLPTAYANPHTLPLRPSPNERASHGRPQPSIEQHAPAMAVTGPSYAAVLQRGLHAPHQQQYDASTQPQQQQQAVVGPSVQEALYGKPQQQQFERQDVAPAPNPSPAPFGGPRRTRTYAEALCSQLAAKDTWSGNAGQFNFDHNETWHTMGQDLMQTEQPFLPQAITSNPNFHSGMNEPGSTLRQWTSQPRTARDRLAPDPRIDTSMLTAPGTPSSQHSPASIASPSSARLSNRRSKYQLLFGHSRLRCHECHAGFETTTDLRHHERSHIPEGVRKYSCNECDKRFLYPKDLKRHVRTHRVNNIFCPITTCKRHWRGFGRQDHLDRHAASQHPVDSAYQSMSQPHSQLES